MKRLFSRRAAAVLALALLALTGLTSCDKPQPALRQMYQLPAFSLVERSGQPFTAASMRGKVWVADFFFATCPGVCLMMNQRLSYVRHETASLPDVRYLSISTDEEDTPEKLRDYANKDEIKAGDRWFFVTGAKSDIFRLCVDGFKLPLVENSAVDSAAEKIDHSTKLVLIDKNGWIRGYYDGIGDNQVDEAKRLIADVKRVAAEPYVPSAAPIPAKPSTPPAAPPVAQSTPRP